MKLLQVYDRQDYDETMPVYEKHSVRAVILREGKLAVQRSAQGECKILGGGVDPGESARQALLREVREESGLLVIPGSIREIGEILEKRRDLYDSGKIYICHSAFYSCEAEAGQTQPAMTESEKAKGFHLEWVTPQEFIAYNENFMDLVWVCRDTEFVRSYLLTDY